MADKIKSGISLSVDFVDGEAPTAAKLNAITSQVRRAADQVERAIGDIHGESWPYTSASDTTLSQSWAKNISNGDNLSGAEERKLDIVNLARLIGPSSNINPRALGGSTTIVEDVPIGVHEFSLRYPVDGPVADVTTTDTSMTDHVASATSLQNAGDWHVTALGKVRSVTATAGGTITYLTNPNEYGGGQSYTRGRFNVIPDPNQIANGNGCTLSALDGQNRRTVTLPTITHQQSDIDGLTIELDDKDINFNLQPLLPRVLTDNLTVGDEIPNGFLYLKNETTGEVYEDASYYYNTTSTVKIGNVDLASAIAASNQFSVLTVGTDITSCIDDLRQKQYHSHNRTYGEPFVQISGIIGQYEEAGNSGVFGPSDVPGNFFSQYLHRDGYVSGDDININDQNAMRGHIVFGITDGTPGTYLNGVGETYGIYFGAVNGSNPHIIKTDAEELEIFNDDGDIVFRTDTLAHAVVSEPVVQLHKGLIGTQIGNIGLGNNGVAPYANVSTFATIGTISTPINISLPAGIKSENWISVNLAVEVQGVAGAFLPGTDLGDNITTSVGGHPGNEVGFVYWWVTTAGVTELFVQVNGNTWLPNTTYDYKLLIWYQPT